MESIMTGRIVVNLKVIDASSAIGARHLKSEAIDCFARLQGNTHRGVVPSFTHLYFGQGKRQSGQWKLFDAAFEWCCVGGFGESGGVTLSDLSCPNSGKGVFPRT